MNRFRQAWRELVAAFDTVGTNPSIECPFCHVVGRVRIWQRQVKRGISGGKATGAILTGGLSLPLTGLSRKQWVRRAKCTNCRMAWTVE